MCEDCEKIHRRYRKERKMLIAFIVVNIIFVVLGGHLKFKDSTGAYFPIIDIATMHNGKDRFADEWMTTAQHEIGHHIFYEVLNGTERELWQNISHSSSEEGYVSEYAKTVNGIPTIKKWLWGYEYKQEDRDVNEDFAESFASTIWCYYNSSELAEINKQKALFVDYIEDNKIYWIKS